MACSRLFGLLAVTLCVMACLCAHGTVSKRDAEQAVRDLKRLTINALENAKQKHRKAEYIKRTIESRKNKAEKAASDAESAAKKIKDSEGIVANAKIAMKLCVQLYADAKEKAEKAINYTEELVLKARILNNNAAIQIVLDTGSSDNYSNVIENAAAVQKATKEFELEITAAEKLLSSADSALWTLSKHAENTQVAKYQVNAIVKVVEIETMMNKADKDIVSLGQKKEKVNATVEEIKELFKNISHKVYLSIQGFLSNAEGDLSIVSRSLNEANETKKEMLKWKRLADDVLVEIKEETDENQAQTQFENVDYHAKNAAKVLETVSKALDSADVYVENVKYRKQSVMNELSKIGSKPNGKDHQVSEKSVQPVDDKTKNTERKEAEREIANNSENGMVDANVNLENAFTVKQRVINLKKTKIETTENHVVDANVNIENTFTVKPTVKNSEKPTIEITENSKQLTSDKLIVKTKEQEETKNSDTLNSNKSTKGIKNITNIPLDGGKTPELGTWSDGSLIVSVPLLAVLIASAVLH